MAGGGGAASAMPRQRPSCASADAEALEATPRQHQRFAELVAEARPQFGDALVHSANSAAMLRLRETHHDMTRPGISLYGYPPPHRDGVVSLRPSLTVKTMVSQIKRVATGEAVGYGRTWTAPVDSMVATLAAGYADGFDRRNDNRGQVLVNGVLSHRGTGQHGSGRRRRQRGGRRGPGTEVTLLGPSAAGAVDAVAVAQRIGIIPNEVLCAVSARVPRITVRRPA